MKKTKLSDLKKPNKKVYTCLDKALSRMDCFPVNTNSILYDSNKNKQ